MQMAKCLDQGAYSLEVEMEQGTGSSEASSLCWLSSRTSAGSLGVCGALLTRLSSLTVSTGTRSSFDSSACGVLGRPHSALQLLRMSSPSLQKHPE